MAGELPRIVIVGAGPAGIAAATALANAGQRPILVDEAPKPGGQIFRQPPPYPGFVRERRELYGASANQAARLMAEFEHIRAKIEYLPGWIAYDIVDRIVYLTDGQHSRSQQWDCLVLATGATDRVIPCPGWTNPGVYSIGGAQIALKHQGCAIGRRIVFAGTGPLLLLAAYQYAQAGAPPAAVLIPSASSALLSALPGLMRRPRSLQRGIRWLFGLRRMGVPIFFSHRISRIHGHGRVTAIDTHSPEGTASRFPCDAVALGYGLRSETQLADLAGVPFRFDPKQRQFLPIKDIMGRAKDTPGLYLAGDGAGILGAEAAEAQGRLVAQALLEDMDQPRIEYTKDRDLKLLAKWKAFQLCLNKAFPFPEDMAASVADETVVCRCELVRAGDLRGAAGVMGARDINRIKAFTRLGMGRCQGRMCSSTAAEILAAKLGVEASDIGRLRGQAPVKPVAVGALSSEPAP